MKRAPSKRTQDGHDIEAIRSRLQYRRATLAEMQLDGDVKSAMLQRWANAFQRAKVDGEVHRHSLRHILELLGYLNPDPADIYKVFKTVSPVYETVDMKDFNRFLESYEQRELDAGLLQPDSELSLDTAWRLVEAFRLRECFSKSEVEQLEAAFQQYDRTGTGEVRIREVGKLLRAYGYIIAFEEQRSLLTEVTAEGTSTLKFHEFKKIARMHRDAEVHKAESIFDEFDQGGRGYIPPFQCRRGVKLLGYEPLIANRIMEDVAGRAVVCMEARVGLPVRRSSSPDQDQSTSESEEEEESDGEDESMEAVLRRLSRRNSALGLHPRRPSIAAPARPLSARRTSLVPGERGRAGAAGLAGDRRLSVCDPDSIRSQRRLSVVEQAKAKKKSRPPTASSHDEPSCSEGGASKEGGTSEDGCADEHSRHKAAKAKMKVEAGAFGVSQSAFLEICRRLHTQKREDILDHAGFCAEEIDAIQRQFVQFDRNVDGGLSQQEVRVMMQDVFPGVSSSARLRPQLLKILEEAGATGTDPDRKLSFAKFIKLMRCLHDLKDQDPVVRQSDIIAYTRFSPKEVEEFQLIFTRATQRDLMGPNEFIQMVGGCCTIDDNYKDMLRRIFTEVVEVDACSRNATFPDFLLLMRRIVDMDFAHIQDGLFAFGNSSGSLSRQVSKGSNDSFGKPHANSKEPR